MKATKQRIFVGLMIMLAFGLAADATTVPRQTGKAEPSRPFHLRAAGQIDLTTGEILFGGVATHLGLYTANGFLNPADFSILGTIEAANGDTLDFTAFFSAGPLGQLEATFNFAGGTGRFAGAVGMASGPATLDPSNFMFLITALGNLAY
jgi:hypothetical protein